MEATPKEGFGPISLEAEKAVEHERDLRQNVDLIGRRTDLNQRRPHRTPIAALGR